MLKFDPKWRFKTLPNGRYHMSQIPSEAISEFHQLIGKIAIQGVRRDVIEEFKEVFSNAAGRSAVWSSSDDWADTDLRRAMEDSAANAPLFLDAFHSASERLATQGLHVPDAEQLNEVCEKHKIGYVFCPPDLLARDSALAQSVPVPSRPASLSEQAMEKIQESWERSEQLLSAGRYREGVAETLWMLESVTTAFRSIESGGGNVKGSYFNTIVESLGKVPKGPTKQVLNWITTLHGYLSSPTGGGVRHGLDLKEGVPVGPSEARLYCNLVRNYVTYLLAEHARLSTSKEK